MTIILKSIVNCESFVLEESFQGTCFEHSFSKACQYGIIEERFAKIWNMLPLSLPKQICQNTSFGLKNMGREDMNGIKLVLKLEFGQGNWTL